MNSKIGITAGQYSDKGTKPVNEDCCGIKVPEGDLLINKGIACVIADGVSSADSAREASEACVKGFLNDYFSTPDSWTVKTAGQRVLGAINRWLHGQSQTLLGSGHAMLTTLSIIVIKSSTAHIFHVGDTRIYRYRNGVLKSLTRDHQTWGGKEKVFLSRAMGADYSVDIDYRSIPVEVGDTYLLTTDGVHEHIHHKILISHLEGDLTHPEKVARNIVTTALENDSNDNVTCQIFTVDSLPEQSEDEFYKQLTELPFPPPLEQGQILDGYRIIRELHASSRSQVYLALDTDTDTSVVLKTPSLNFQDDAEYIDGFLHEEWAGRRINNTHVLKVLKKTGRRRFLYYVCEYIEGQTLAQWINDNPRADIKDVRPIIQQIVSGVRAFHRQEMIHQDLKPDNIILDQHGTVKIIDFGSTKIAGIQEINSPIQQGNLLGTFDYAAPEYFEGYSGTTRADLYSIATIAYEMLTGKLPYGRPLSAKHLKRVRYVPAHQENPLVPAWIDGALEKAVQLAPQHRHDHMSEFIADITTPNSELMKKQPLMESNPVGFWKGLTVILLLLNILLLYRLYVN